MARAIAQSASKAPAAKRVSASAPSKRPTPRPHISAEAIAERAYHKYQARGCEDGFAELDWLGAEEELLADSKRTK